MFRASRYLLLVAVVATLFVQVTAAVGAPVGWKSVDVTLHAEQQQSLLLVSGELPAEATLPYETELAVPAGTQLQWIGEILGGDPSKDPELKYAKSSANGVDVYRFTLTKARVAQVEGVIPNATTFDGTNYATGLKWTVWQDVPEVRISQRIPQGSQIVQAAVGATVEPGPTGYSYYTKTVASPKAGEVLDFSFGYTVPAPGATSGATSSSDTVALTAVTLITIGGFALLLFGVRKKLALKAAQSAPAPAPVRAAMPVAQPSGTQSKTTSKRGRTAEPVVEPAPRKPIKPAIPVLMTAAILLAVIAIVASGGTTADAGGNFTRDFGAVSPCQSGQVPFTVNQGVDITQEANRVLEGLEGMDGVGVVTIDPARSVIDMQWCESSQSEESMRQALSSSGVITVGEGVASASSAPATATVDASGEKQAINVDTSSGSFAPSRIAIKAGIPADVTFGQAAGCLTEVVIADLGIDQDLTGGGATVALPALEAGTYSFACAMGHQTGEIVVQ